MNSKTNGADKMSLAIDMRSTNLGMVNFFRSATKREACAFAKANGWRASDCCVAANRFCQFWLVCQGIDAETLRILNQDGSWSDIQHPGYW